MTLTWWILGSSGIASLPATVCVHAESHDSMRSVAVAVAVVGDDVALADGVEVVVVGCFPCVQRDVVRVSF